MGRRSPHATTVRRPCAALVGRCKGRPSGARAARPVRPSGVLASARSRDGRARAGTAARPPRSTAVRAFLRSPAAHAASHRIASHGTPRRGTPAPRGREGTGAARGSPAEKKKSLSRGGRAAAAPISSVCSTLLRGGLQPGGMWHTARQTKRNETKRNGAARGTSHRPALCVRAICARSPPADPPAPASGSSTLCPPPRHHRHPPPQHSSAQHAPPPLAGGRIVAGNRRRKPSHGRGPSSPAHLTGARPADPCSASAKRRAPHTDPASAYVLPSIHPSMHACMHPSIRMQETCSPAPSRARLRNSARPASRTFPGVALRCFQNVRTPTAAIDRVQRKEPNRAKNKNKKKKKKKKEREKKREEKKRERKKTTTTTTTTNMDCRAAATGHPLTAGRHPRPPLRLAELSPLLSQPDAYLLTDHATPCPALSCPALPCHALPEPAAHRAPATNQPPPSACPSPHYQVVCMYPAVTCVWYVCSLCMCVHMYPVVTFLWYVWYVWYVCMYVCMYAHMYPTHAPAPRKAQKHPGFCKALPPAHLCGDCDVM